MCTPRGGTGAVERSISRASILPCCVYRKMRSRRPRRRKKAGEDETHPGPDCQRHNIFANNFEIVLSVSATHTEDMIYKKLQSCMW